MKLAFRNIARVSLLAIALVALVACGGGGGTPTRYSIGGTASGLNAGQSVFKVAELPAERLYRDRVAALASTFDGSDVEAKRAALRSLVGPVSVFEKDGALWGRFALDPRPLLMAVGVTCFVGSGGPIWDLFSPPDGADSAQLEESPPLRSYGFGFMVA
jgi:hypothetical protein